MNFDITSDENHTNNGNINKLNKVLDEVDDKGSF